MSIARPYVIFLNHYPQMEVEMKCANKRQNFENDKRYFGNNFEQTEEIHLKL